MVFQRHRGCYRSSGHHDHSKEGEGRHSEVKRPAPNHRAGSYIVNLLLPDVCLPSFCVSAARLQQMPFWSFKIRHLLCQALHGCATSYFPAAGGGLNACLASYLVYPHHPIIGRGRASSFPCWDMQSSTHFCRSLPLVS